MKKIVSILIATVFAVGVLTGCGSNTPATNDQSVNTTDNAAKGEVITLKLGHNNPGQGMTGQSYDKYAEFVSELSGGTIKIEQYPGGTLVDDTNSFDSVMDGSIDMIHDMVSKETNRITDLAPLEIPGYYTGEPEEWPEFAESLRGTLDSIYEPLGIKYIASNYQGTSCLVSTVKDITTPDDMKGMSVRAMGTWLSQAVSAWGGSSVTLSLGELSTALERKTVDAAMTGWTIAIPNAFYESCASMTYTKFTETHAVLLMNLEIFNSLTEEQQGWLIEAGKMLEDYTVELANQNYQEGIDAAKSSGCNVIELTQEQNQVFADKLTPLFESCKESLSDTGLELMNIIGK